MVKDRFAEFQKKGNVKFKSSNASSSSNGGGMVAINLKGAFPSESSEFLNVQDWDDIEAFLERVKEVKPKLEEMERCIDHMKVIHSKILISPGVHSDFTNDLNATVERFKKLSYESSATVKRMNEEAERATKTQDINLRIKKNQAMGVNRRLHNLLAAFNNVQIEYRDKCNQKIGSYLKISGVEMAQEDVDAAIEDGNLFNTVGILMAERDKKQLFEDVKSRHDDIIRLESSIRELHEIFQDMYMLVQSQGEMMNHIETNVSTAVESASKALYAVNYAKKAKSRNIKLKICLAICAIIVILLVFFFGATAFCFYTPFC